MLTFAHRAAACDGDRPTPEISPSPASAACSRARADRDLLRGIAALVRDHLKQANAHAPADNADDPYATIAWPSCGAGPASSRFRVLRPHARGGLGEVYLAHDEELHREVALKEIQPHHADDPTSRSRFVLEAEITGRLEHPGVVPVYSFGEYADGRPFYAMRMIKGVRLTDAIKDFHAGPAGAAFGSRKFRGLLGRFIDICNAIEYAHSRGVLHRDLKPDNVMLGKYGETLVVDWGLAKILHRPEATPRGDEPTLQPASGSDSAATQMGATLGTPRYMSPEQAEHWLADEPVTALRDPIHDRLARWTRRHRAWTHAAAATLTLTTMFAVAAALLVERERRAERTERQLAALNRDAAEDLTRELSWLTRSTSAAGHPAIVGSRRPAVRRPKRRWFSLKPSNRSSPVSTRKSRQLSRSAFRPTANVKSASRSVAASAPSAACSNDCADVSSDFASSRPDAAT